jgi:hypothetical protein
VFFISPTIEKINGFRFLPRFATIAYLRRETSNRPVLKSILLFFALLAYSFSFGQCCDYTLVGNDSYGDGWNGGSLDIYVNGEVIESFSAVDQGSSFSFEVCDEDEIYFEYFSGEYENENTWFLVGGVGNLVFGDGPEPVVGISETFVTDCSIESDPGTNACSAIEGEFGCVEIDNSTAPGSSLTPTCANYQGGDLWFTFTVPESGSLLFSTESIGELNDTGLAVWTGESCTGLQQILCDDDSGPGYLSLIPAFNLEPGIVLYLQVWGWSGQTGAVNLCALDPGTVELESSVLPVFLIETDGQVIEDDEKITADLRILYNGPSIENFMTDLPTEYDGKIGIEIRGATSSGYPQKPYGFETRNLDGTNNNVGLVEMPAENDWVLLSNFNDRSFIRNTLAQHLFEKMGNYAPRATLCEVQLNGNYQGVYVFGEKIKRDAGRLNIATLNADELSGDDVTGGYILQMNYWNDQNSWELSYNPPNNPEYDVHLRYEYPKADVIAQEQKDYIAAFVDSMETAIYSEDFDDMETGYRQFLDVESFIDYFLLNEVSRNNDGFKKSRFFFKDKYSNGGKFKAGPPWDFDWGWKNLTSCEIFESTEGEGWAHLINSCPTDNYSPEWYVRLLQDSTFGNHMRCRYDEYRDDFLNMDYLGNYIDSVATLLVDVQARHYQKWPFLGMATASPELDPIPETYLAEMEFLKDWIEIRLEWLDANLPQECTGIPISVQEQGIISDKIYPNPSTGRFTVNSSADLLNVYTLDGRLLYAHDLSTRGSLFEFTINEKGMFICAFQSANEVRYQKVVVE